MMPHGPVSNMTFTFNLHIRASHPCFTCAACMQLTTGIMSTQRG
jgi:hypothetical protein